VAWSWRLTDEQRGGSDLAPVYTSPAVGAGVRYQLMRLKLGEDLTHIIRGGAKRLIAPAEEVLKLKPELHAAT